MTNSKLVVLENTRFIYTTNFSGDPSRDNFGDDRRKCNIIIPTEEQAKDISDAGYKVKRTKPHRGEDPDTFTPEWYIEAQVKYRKRNGEQVKYKPQVFLIPGEGQAKIQLDEDTVGQLDFIRVKNVNVVLNPWEKDDGGIGAYVRTLYVEQDMDDDPFAARYAVSGGDYDGDETAPF